MARARAFDVLLRPEPEGGFTVRVPAFPEIVTWGDDEAEVLAMAQEAIELVIEDRLARGEPVPSNRGTRHRGNTRKSQAASRAAD